MKKAKLASLARPSRDPTETPTGPAQFAKTVFGARVLEAMEKYPVDRVTGQDLFRREYNRAAILGANPERAAPYLAKPATPEDILIDQEISEGLTAGIRYLEETFRQDMPVRLLLAAVAHADVNFKSSKELSRACGITVAQVKAAKERMKYAIQKVGADSFDDFLNRVTRGI